MIIYIVKMEYNGQKYEMEFNSEVHRDAYIRYIKSVFKNVEYATSEVTNANEKTTKKTR